MTQREVEQLRSVTGRKSLDQKDSLEKGMATHSSILARRILWTEELQSMESQRVRYDLVTHLSSVAESCLTLCEPMDCSSPGFPVHHQLLECAQTYVHRVDDAIQPSRPLSSPSPPALNLSQHQDLCPMSQFFESGGQSIRASASTSVLPMNIQD